MMKDTFSIVDPEAGSNFSDIYHVSDVNLDPGYTPSTKSKFLRRLDCCVWTALILLLIGIASFLAISCWPELGSENVPKMTENETDSFPTIFMPPKRTYHALKPNSRNDSRLMNNFTLSKQLDKKKTALNTQNVAKLKHLLEPLSYDIYIQLMNARSDPTFSGKVSIVLMTKEEVKHIIIGAKDLRILSVTLTTEDTTDGRRKFYRTSIDSYDVDEGTLVVQVYETMTPNTRYLLQIMYNGDVRNEPYGLFRISYQPSETDENSRTLIAANTETPFARTIFPCFDLPTQTASFTLNICREESMIAVSGGSFSSPTSERSTECVWDTFSLVNGITTNLFGFAISNYLFERATTDNGATYTIWTSTTSSGSTYLADITPRLLDTFADYFGQNLPTDNIDIYCVPTVMPYITSKLGVIIASESDIAVSKTEPFEYQKEKVAKTTAVHLAEQWVEYLITFEDRDQWIKEALVQYLQYIAVNEIEPQWRIFEEFFTSVLQPELDPDTLNPTQKKLDIQWISYLNHENEEDPLYPIMKTATYRNHLSHWKIMHSVVDDRAVDPAIYSELFAQRIMEKGICLFRMLQHILTETIFRNSLQSFLNFSKGKIVTADDLWNIMTVEASNANVPGYQLLPTHMTLKVIVNEWVFNKDYPVLKVLRRYDKGTIFFIQFLDNQDGNYILRKPGFRHIPVSYTTGLEKDFAATTPRLWLKNAKQTIMYNPPNLSNNTWLLVNPRQTDLYRVNYDDQNWRMLKESMEKKELPPVIRAQLLDDALFLGRRGFLNYEFALNFTLTLGTTKETEYIVWNTVLRHFQYIQNILDSIEDEELDSYKTKFNNYIKQLITPVFRNLSRLELITDDRLQYPTMDHSKILWQTDVYMWACKVGTENCITKVRTAFDQWKQEADPDLKNPIKPDFRYAVLCSTMQDADASDFEFLYYRYMNTSLIDPNKYIYLKSLYCYQKIDRTLPSILSDTLMDDYSLIHLYEVSSMWQALAESSVISKAPFEYLLTNWATILNKFSEYTPILANILEGATVNISSEDHLNSIYGLKEGNTGELEDINEIFTEVIRHVKFRINWRYQELNAFLSWLNKVAPSEPQPT